MVEHGYVELDDPSIVQYADYRLESDKCCNFATDDVNKLPETDGCRGGGLNRATAGRERGVGHLRLVKIEYLDAATADVVHVVVVHARVGNAFGYSSFECADTGEKPSSYHSFTLWLAPSKERTTLLSVRRFDDTIE